MYQYDFSCCYEDHLHWVAAWVYLTLSQKLEAAIIRIENKKCENDSKMNGVGNIWGSRPFPQFVRNQNTTERSQYWSSLYLKIILMKCLVVIIVVSAFTENFIFSYPEMDDGNENGWILRNPRWYQETFVIPTSKSGTHDCLLIQIQLTSLTNWTWYQFRNNKQPWC